MQINVISERARAQDVNGELPARTEKKGKIGKKGSLQGAVAEVGHKAVLFDREDIASNGFLILRKYFSRPFSNLRIVDPWI